MKTRDPGLTIFGQSLSSKGFIAQTLANPNKAANQKLKQIPQSSMNPSITHPNGVKTTGWLHQANLDRRLSKRHVCSIFRLGP